MNIQSMGLGPVNTAAAASPSPVTPPGARQAAQVSTKPVEVPAKPEAVTPENQTTSENLTEQTENAVQKIAKFVEFSASDLQFSIDKETEIPVVKVIDRTTKEVIRQMPSQEAIEISKALDKLNGLLIQNKA